MDRLVRRHLKKALVKGAKREYYEKEYIIYKEEEAKARRIYIKPWKECEPGDWGLSDDGYVSQCTKKRIYKGIYEWIRTGLLDGFMNGFVLDS